MGAFRTRVAATAVALKLKELAGRRCDLNARHWRHSHLTRHGAGRADPAPEKRAVGREGCAMRPGARWGLVSGSGCAARG